MYSLKQVTDESFSGQDWQDYYEMILELHRKYNTLLASTSCESFKKRALANYKIKDNNRDVVVYKDDKPVAYCILFTTNTGQSDRYGQFFMNGLVDDPDPALQILVGKYVADFIESYQLPFLFHLCFDERLAWLPDSWGAERLNGLDRYRLGRDEADNDLINRWLDEIPAANPNLHIEYKTRFPEEEIEEYTRMFNSFFREMPSEHEKTSPFTMTEEYVRKVQSWRDKHGLVMLNSVLYNADRMIGYSSVNIRLENPAYVYQAMTGVLKEYRGRGLAKWLKAAGFREVLNRYPENKAFMTEMRSVNEPIQHINRLMGYKLLSRGFEYRIDPADLNKFLASIS